MFWLWCIFLLGTKLEMVKSESENYSFVSNYLQPLGYEVHGTLQAGVASLFLLQGIFPNQRLNSGLPHCRRILYQLSHKASPRILEWVAYPCSSGSSQPRNRTRVSCIAGRLFTNWAIREALPLKILFKYEKQMLWGIKTYIAHIYCFGELMI